MKNIIPYQLELCQALPEIFGSIDYINFKNNLLRIEKIIEEYKLEDTIIEYNLKKRELERKEKSQRKLSFKEKINIKKESIQALYCTVAKNITQDSFRDFACRLGDSVLFQTFCKINNFGKIQIPGKSVLQRYSKIVPDEIIKQITNKLILGVIENKEKINLKEPIILENIYYDTTCVESNIHFPVDWLLLRDIIKSLMKSVILIRGKGLKNRMNTPQQFIKTINQLCIKMTHTRRKVKGKKMRKKIFREMKKLTKKVEKHAKIHFELLKENWEESGFTETKKNQILKRIENVLEKLPQAIYQAQERIIGERYVPSKEKILSIHEENVNIIVRGKASAEVEFGNKLLIAEIKNGLIIDWELYKDGSPSDSKMMPESLDRIYNNYGEKIEIKSVTADRGFVNKTTDKYLEKNKINNHICPKTVNLLEEKLKDEFFCENQKRRSQTEGRIGIVKNNFLGKPFRNKGFKSRNIGVSWNILTHNLWVISRLLQKEAVEEIKIA